MHHMRKSVKIKAQRLSALIFRLPEKFFKNRQQKQLLVRGYFEKLRQKTGQMENRHIIDLYRKKENHV